MRHTHRLARNILEIEIPISNEKKIRKIFWISEEQIMNRLLL